MQEPSKHKAKAQLVWYRLIMKSLVDWISLQVGDVGVDWISLQVGDYWDMEPDA